ncbi:hypothetical protein SAMN04487972_102186 [Paracoccus halophilus]|uniref:Histidine kinase n=1 Tax=Paracoccus halophilus TaxID=376733 RepID=A0A099F8A8_9RHOB|nr:DUF6446 family protein [Paracoccus halophilus]KGJ06759.1 histidine kinase [Paracoccus halophilus]SFA41757.1 hypothetical protein SAMN04487972_102186 [Paracoccus halophilus]
MNGKWPVLALLAAAALVGGGIWYAQEYAYYDEIDPAAADLTIMAGGQAQPLPVRDARIIDASSAPHRWRGCFRLDGPLPPAAERFPAAAPAYGPNWFDCFEADRIGHDLETGAATAYLSRPEIRPDVDRVIAVYPDGRAYGWHQYNDKTPERGVMD